MPKSRTFEEVVAIQPAKSLSEQFLEIAKVLYGGWEICTEDRNYEIIEAEFLLCTKDETHPDPNIDKSPLQYTTGNWYIPHGKIDITIGCESYAAAVFIRSVRDLKTGEDTVGPNRSFEKLFQNAGNIQTGQSQVVFQPLDSFKRINVFAVPRVSVQFEERSTNKENRMKFLFRPYRIIRSDMLDFPDKYLSQLYLEKAHNSSHHIELSSSIYAKYLKHFDMGRKAYHLDEIWRVSSKSLRTAAVLGYVYENHRSDLY
ncbi:MAG: hypothetical protein Salg2KO_12660 [Salibacteraceae bacterium]